MATHADAQRLTPAALSVRDAAAYVGLHPATLWRLVRSGALPRPIVLSPGRRAWLRAELDEWLAKRSVERDQADIDVTIVTSPIS